MTRLAERIGHWLCIAAGVLCVAMHVATFVTSLAPVWILIPFGLIALAIICDRSARNRLPYSEPISDLRWLQVALLAYAIGTFVYFYETTGGATGVEVMDGQYVSMYKSRVLKVISEHEFRNFPSLWTRVMSSWIGMMAVSGLRRFQPIWRMPLGRSLTQ